MLVLKINVITTIQTYNIRLSNKQQCEITAIVITTINTENAKCLVQKEKNSVTYKWDHTCDLMTNLHINVYSYAGPVSFEIQNTGREIERERKGGGHEKDIYDCLKQWQWSRFRNYPACTNRENLSH